TRCPACRATVIGRYGYLIRSYRLTPDGRCPHCQTRLPGVWPAAAAEVRTGNDQAAYLGRLPRPVAAPAAAPTPGLRPLPLVQDAFPSPPGASAPMSAAVPAAPPSPAAPLTDDQPPPPRVAITA